jgi:transposase-like protein
MSPLLRSGLATFQDMICSALQEMRYSAKRFFSKALAAPHISTPRVITVDTNEAYLKASKVLRAEGFMPDPCESVYCRVLKWRSDGHSTDT